MRPLQSHNNNFIKTIMKYDIINRYLYDFEIE